MRSPAVGFSVSVKHATDAGLYVINIIFAFVAVFQRSSLVQPVTLTVTASLEPRAPAMIKNVFVETPWSPRRITPRVVSRDFHLVSFSAV